MKELSLVEISMVCGERKYCICESATGVGMPAEGLGELRNSAKECAERCCHILRPGFWFDNVHYDCFYNEDLSLREFKPVVSIFEYNAKVIGSVDSK